MDRDRETEGICIHGVIICGTRKKSVKRREKKKASRGRKSEGEIIVKRRRDSYTERRE